MRPEPALITAALSALEDDQKSKQPSLFSGSKIPRKYNGYVASLGGSIVQLGIMPACMAFMADDNKAKLATMLFQIYVDLYAKGETLTLDDYLKESWKDWNRGERNLFRSRMTAIAVSMKLAMRTYEFDETESMD